MYMFNNNDRQQIEEIMKKNPEFNCLVLKVLEQYNFSICKFSHELRNPITLISSSLQLIESQHPEVKDFKFWNETMDDIQYVCSLLDELSCFNKSANLNVSEYSIIDLLDSTSSSICSDFNSSTRKFTCHYSKTLPTIRGDFVKIRQVITNLLKNAKDAIDEVSGTISLSAYCKDDAHIQIEISDNGCGIPKERQDSVFEPFVTYKPNGSGLGLPICKRIIEAHKGCISFQSSLNEGTTFYITLPINPQI
jgi:signal transduction histidine kinase